MDFDSSRTPSILYKHFGIENEKSVLEWNKHSSIVGWRLDVNAENDQVSLLYSAECQHPIHEKTIREFGKWIDFELSSAELELELQRRQVPPNTKDIYRIYLPKQARLDIQPARDPQTNQPSYIYHDLQFRLNQDEIQQLLMGESLYGKPELCIRELIQNALDAIELRELRLKLKQKSNVIKPVNGILKEPGIITNGDGNEEELHVELSWGTDDTTGQQWLKVCDNGVGMSLETIQHYFTQIGKSFYRSSEFKQEKAAMKAYGEHASPISRFGIGILSCFMICDRITVHTCSAEHNHGELKSLNVNISGPGSLFWITKGTKATQGTEICIYVKSEFLLQQNSQDAISKLKEKFGYKDRDSNSNTNDAKPCSKDQSKIIDPVLASASHIIWPKYPIIVQNDDKVLIRIDNELHHKLLSPINKKQLCKIADKWGLGTNLISKSRWVPFDWEDGNSTGSRIRVWFPRKNSVSNQTKLPIDSSNSDTKCCLLHELASLVEGQIYGAREIVLVNGMYVSDTSFVDSLLEVSFGVGTRIWIDLRGAASPSLTASRDQLFPPKDFELWKETLSGIFHRFRLFIESEINNLDINSINNLTLGITFRRHLLELTPKKDEFNLVSDCGNSWKCLNEFGQVLYWNARLTQYLLYRDKTEYSRYSESNLTVPDNSYDTPVKLCISDANYMIERVCGDKKFALLDNFIEEVDTSHVEIDLDYFDDTQIAELSSLKAEREQRIEFTDEFVDAFPTFLMCLHASPLQHSFDDNLTDSWPMLGLQAIKGSINDANLHAPGIAKFVFESDGKRPIFGEGDSNIIEDYEYDLCFPMTAISVGNLRKYFDKWRVDSKYHSLAMAPFLLPALNSFWQENCDLFNDIFKVDSIYALMPPFRLWSKRFSDWTKEDVSDSENLSILWDLKGKYSGVAGQLLWAQGIHPPKKIANVGCSTDDFLGYIQSDS